MAYPLKAGADLYNHELLRARLQNLGAQPSTADVGLGQIYFNTGSDTAASKRIGYCYQTGGVPKFHHVANLEDIARLERLIAELGDVSGGNITDLLNRIKEAERDIEAVEGRVKTIEDDYLTDDDKQALSALITTLQGYFSNGVANDAAKLGGQLPSYYAQSSALSQLRTEFDALYKTLNDDTTGIINTWQEVVDFVNEYSGSEDLSTILAGMNTQIENRYTKGEIDTKLLAYRLLTNGVFDVLIDANKGITTDEITIGGIKLSVVDGQLCIEGDAFATGQLSSGGVGEEGGSEGVGGLVVLDDWDKYDASLNQVVGASLGIGLRDRIVAAEGTLSTHTSNIASLGSRIDALASKATNVSVAQTLTSGKEIGAITIDGVATKLYAPATYAWGEITSKPTTVAGYGITDAVKYYGAYSVDSARCGVGYDNMSQGSVGLPVMGGGFIAATQGKYGFQIIGGYSSSSHMFWRNVDNDTLGTWRKVLDDTNYASVLGTVYAPYNAAGYLPLSGGTMSGALGMTAANVPTGAVGMWGTAELFLKASGAIKFFNSADSTFSEILHTRNYATILNNAYLKLSGGTITGNLQIGSNDNTAYNYLILVRSGKALRINCHGTAAAIDYGSYSNGTLTSEHALSLSDYGLQYKVSGTPYDVLHKGNFNSYAPTLTGTGASGTWGIDITGNAASATKLATARSFWGNLFDGTGDVTGGIAFNSVQKISWNSNADSYYIRSSVFTGATNPSLEFCAWGGHYFSSQGVTRLIINQAGNVSIGAEDLAGDKYRLLVDGVFKVREKTSARLYTRIANAGVQIGRNSSLYTGGYNGGLSFGEDESVLGYIAGMYNERDLGYTWFFYGGTSYNDAAITISGIDGNVGIGTGVGTAYKLDVKGTFRASGVATLSSRLIVGPLSDDGSSTLQVYNTARFTDGALTTVIGNGRWKTYASGSWARTLSAWKSDNSAELGGFGFLVNNDVLTYLYIGTYSKPYMRIWPDSEIECLLNVNAKVGVKIPTGQTLKIGDATLSWDSTAQALKVDKDFYSDGQVSSGGVAEEGDDTTTGGSGLERVVFTIPSGTTTFDCEHNLGTREISVAIYEEGNDYQQVLTDVYLDSTNIARIVFGSATDVAHKVVIIG